MHAIEINYIIFFYLYQYLLAEKEYNKKLFEEYIVKMVSHSEWSSDKVFRQFV